MSSETAAIHETCGKLCGKPLVPGLPTAAANASTIDAYFLGKYHKPLELFEINMNACVDL